MAGLMMGLALTPKVAMAESCGDATFFGLKSWYAHLECENGNIAQSNFEGDNLSKSIWTIVLTVLADLFFVAGLLAVVLIIVSGIQFITSGGDPGAAAKAKKSLTGTIVGLVICLLAHVIVNTIMNLVGGS